MRFVACSINRIEFYKGLIKNLFRLIYMMMNCHDVIDNDDQLNAQLLLNNIYHNDEAVIDENNNNDNNISTKRKQTDHHAISSRDEKTSSKKSSKHKRKESRSRYCCNKCNRSRSRESPKRKKKNAEYRDFSNSKRQLFENEARGRESRKKKQNESRSRSVCNRSCSKEARRRKYSDYVDSYYLTGRFRESNTYKKEMTAMLNSQRSIEIIKYDEGTIFKNHVPHRNSRYSRFYANNRFNSYNYPYGSQYQNNEYSNELLFHNQTSMMETEILTDDEKVEENDGILQNNESEFFISSSSSSLNQNQQKKINSKIVDMLDIDWSILNNNNKSSTKNSASSFERVFSPSFILSTIGTINECLDEKMKEKVKDFTEKEKDSEIVNIKNVNDSYLHGLSFLKRKIENRTVNNFDSFNFSPGISMRNDIERRKAFFMHQINNHITQCLQNNESFKTSDNVPSNPPIGFQSKNSLVGDYEFRHIEFYNQALQMLKDEDDDVN